MPKKKHGHALYRNKSPIYKRWANMVNRCHNPNNHSYDRYGGRGVTVCDRWRHDFAAFLADMGPIPFDGAQIERKKNDEGYSPDNCEWSTAKDQARNRRSSHMVTFNGVTLTVAAWAETEHCIALGLSANALTQRLTVYKWTVERAMTTPARSWSPGKPKTQNQL